MELLFSIFACEFYTFASNYHILLFDEKTAKDLFKKYSIDLPDFEADENIDDIEKSLKSSNYICEKVSSDKSE